MANGSILSNLGEMMLPKGIKIKLRDYLLKAGVPEVPFSKFGLLFVLSLIINIVFYSLFLFKRLAVNLGGLVIGSVLSIVILQITFFILIIVLFWVYYDIKMYRRTVQIEKVLPDFLEAVSVNLRAGMTFDKALWNSVEPEYGVLENEIEVVAKKVMSGEDTEQALREFSSKYSSPILKESISLIIIGIRSGGEVSDLIDRVVENVKTAAYLKQELVANVMSYVIFISMVALLIAPALFALSYQLMLIIQSLGAKLSGAGSTFIAVEFGKELIKKEDFINYSRACIMLISVASSAIIADLREGSIKGGIKYIFFFILISYFVYEVMLIVFTGIFGVLI